MGEYDDITSLRARREVEKGNRDHAGGADFLVRDLFSGGGSYVNLEGMRAAGVRSVTVRYQKDRKVAVLKVP